jgi:hypothetical protein
MKSMAQINVRNTDITIVKIENVDYISLTDIAKVRDKENPAQIVSLWLGTYSAIEYIGLWEMLNNPNFKPHIYEGFKNESAKPHFWTHSRKQNSNAVLINDNVSQRVRLIKLNQIAIRKMSVLSKVESKSVLH